MKKILILCLLLAAQYSNAQAIKLNIDATRVVYNSLYHKAFVAVDTYDPLYPKSILQIDPLAGTVEKHISLPGIPFIIRQTTDLKYLFVSYQYQPDILKIKLDDFTIADNIMTNELDVLDFAVKPADNNTLVVIRGDGGYPDDMVMYKDGILQPKQERTDSDLFSALCFKNDGSRLYAHNRVSTGFEGRLVNILDDGVEFTGKTWDYMIPAFSFIKNHNDLLYDQSGDFIDLFSDSIPKQIAQIPIYKITEYSRTGSEYSDIHGCYVFGHAIDYKGYISFFHGEHYNYLGSFALPGQVEMIYDLAVVDYDHFIVVALGYSGENNFLLLFTGNSKDKMALPARPATLKQRENPGNPWGNSRR
ncbi:MAG: hypothetical protein WCR72_05380 [Bacteroidota bacterium]